MPVCLPAAQVDGPAFDNALARHQMHPFVVGDGGIDVCRNDANAIADPRQRDGFAVIALGATERDVFVGAEPHAVAVDRRIAVIHAKRLEPAVGDRVVGGTGDHGGEEE